MAAVTTRSYSNLRDGACFDETKLTSIWVQKNGIRVLGEFKLDDPRGTEGQVLFVPFIMMRDKQVHNVAYVVDMSNNVYAFDTDTYNLLWKQHIARPVVVDKTLDMWGINPFWGILSTPVIDLNTATLYCVALNSHDGTIGAAQYELHGLDLVDGSYRFPPLPLNGATYQNFHLGSTPRKQRPGLLLDTRNGRTTIFIAFGSFYESASTNQGWVVAVDVTHAPTISATWVTGTKYPAAGIWMGGQGLSMDPDGFIYGMTGNGGFQPPTDFGECFFKLRYTPPSDSTDGTLECVDWWSPYSDTGRDGMDPTLPAFGIRMGQNAGREHLWPTNAMNDMVGMDMSGMLPTNANTVKDEDLGSGGPLLIPSSLTGYNFSAIIGAGKDGIAYTVNMDKMGQTQNADFAPGKTDGNFAKLLAPPYNFTDYLGGFNSVKNPMTIPGGYGGNTRHQHSTPVFYRSPDHGWMLFTQGENSPVRAFKLNPDATLTYLACGQELASNATNGMPGGMLSLSCSGQGTNTGILWSLMPLNGDANRTITQGRLVLYGANWLSGSPGSATLIKIWDSYQWNVVFAHNKFNVPTIANGKCFVPSYDGRVLVLG